MDRAMLVMLLLVLLPLLGGASPSQAFSLEEEVEVYYIQAPLMEHDFNNLFSYLKAFHSGLYFYTRQTKLNYTLEYVAIPSIRDAIFPLDINATANTITWNSAGGVLYTEQFNSSYWTGGQQYLMTISGYTLQNYLCWVQYYNQSNPWYNLFEVHNNATNYEYLNSSICDDFVWVSLQTLFDLGGSLTEAPVLAPARDFVRLYVTQPPTLVNTSDPSAMAEMVVFYELMKPFPNETLQQFIMQMERAFSGTFFYYYSGVYYNLTLAPANPISFTYVSSPLPSGARRPDNVPYLSTCQPVYPQTLNRTRFGLIIAAVSIAAVFVLFAIYMMVGVIYNVAIKGKPFNSKALPNHAFWSSCGKRNKNIRYAPLVVDDDSDDQNGSISNIRGVQINC